MAWFLCCKLQREFHNSYTYWEVASFALYPRDLKKNQGKEVVPGLIWRGVIYFAERISTETQFTREYNSVNETGVQWKDCFENPKNYYINFLIGSQ